MDQQKAYNILKAPILFWALQVVAWLVLGYADSSISQPLWEYIFLMSSEEAEWLSRGTCIIYLILAYSAAHSFAAKRRDLAALCILAFLSLIFFAFLGLETANFLKQNDALNLLFADEGSLTVKPQYESHYVALGLSIALFFASVLIDYLVAFPNEALKDLRIELRLASLLRLMESKLEVLEGVCERAEAKPIQLAKNKVNARLEANTKLMDEHGAEVRELRKHLAHQLLIVRKICQVRLAIIQEVYDKNDHSFFKRIFR